MTSWSLCLVSASSAAGSNRKVVKVNPSSDTVGDLFKTAAEAFGVPSVEALKTGFPPLALDASDSTLLSESNKIGNQERVQVVLSEKKSTPTTSATSKAKGKKGRAKKDVKSNAAAAAEAPITCSSENPDTSTSTSTRRPKRAAAQAATDSFAAVIRQQDRIMKAEKQPQSKKAKKGATNGISKGKPKAKRAPAFTSKEPGRRLADGAVVGSPSKPKPSQSKSSSRTRKTALPEGQKQHEDMSTALLDTLNQTGTGGKILRKTMKSAVQNSYENTKAVARLAALESRNPQESVQMELVQDKTKLKVRFQKGLQGRGYYEEVVDWIPTEVLKDVLKAILKSNAENLRPQNLALLSPRFLWALAYRHWETQQEAQSKQEAPSPWEPFSVEEAYKQLMPDRKDWAFLRRRKQALSAKAMENLRQQNEEEEGSDGENYDKAEEAVQEVEQAMGSLQHYDRTQRAERIANAALARQLRQQQANAGEEAWEIITPSEDDEDELMECIAASQTSLKEPKDASKVAKLLIQSASARNWRELANQEPSNLHTQIVDTENSLSHITEQQVTEWIDHARLQTLEEIMVEICDGSIAHVQLLRDNSPTNTPKDLATWIAMPDLLLEELGDAASEKLSMEDLGRFCNRASRALQSMEWLTWYVTSVE